MSEKKSRYWISWYQPTEDYRPLTDPPDINILAWWNSGERADGAAVLCAIVTATTNFGAENAVLKSWPEATEFRFNDKVAADWLPGGRFPVDRAWEKKRLDIK